MVNLKWDTIKYFKIFDVLYGFNLDIMRKTSYLVAI